MKVCCGDKIIKFLGEKSSILFSQHFDFCEQNKGDCEDQRKKDKAMRTSCVCC
jgi:hypothetical protein